MGLDGVEMIMEVEDEFGITIPDSEASAMRTVGDLVDLCLDRINKTKTMRCPTSPCFLALRKLVREIRNDSDLKILPGDNIESCLQTSDRQILWHRLPELLKTEPRQLRRPSWLRKTLVIVVLAFPIVLMTVLPWSAGMLMLIWFATFAFGLTVHKLTIGFRTRTPKGYHTFADITKRMVGLQIATTPPVETDYESVFSIVKSIVSDQLGVDVEEVTPTARFVEDLGMG